MSKIKLVFFSSLLVGFALIFVFRDNLLRYFEPRLADLEKTATDFVIREIKKEVNAPPPLRIYKETVVRETPLTVIGVIKFTNDRRRENGFIALAHSEELDAVARLRVKDMFAKQYFAHISPSGDGAVSAANEIRYDYIAIGENLALGNFLNDEDLVRAWMDSPGHRANWRCRRQGTF
jgi:uncharacterized protein YkwD